MNWLDKLERKIGRFAIPNLTVYLLIGYVIGFGIMYLMPEMVGYLTLEPALILRGQVWRIDFMGSDSAYRQSDLTCISGAFVLLPWHSSGKDVGKFPV